MAVNINVLLLVVIFGSSGEGQQYFLGETDTGAYFTDQEQFTNRPVPFHHTTSLHNYYIPKDLQTSELPSHLQVTLPQYQRHVIPKQSFRSSIPFPFRLAKEYVEPSTHRPDYSHFLPQPNHNEHLHTHISYENDSPKNQLESSSDVKELDGNEFETEDKGALEDNLTNISNASSSVDLNPISNVNKENNQLELHFNKRDSSEEATKDKLNEDENLEQPNEQTYDSDKGTEDGSSDKENNELNDSEYDEEYEYDDDESEDDESQKEVDGNNQKKNETYEVLTMRPITSSQDGLNDFVDVDSMDTTTQEPSTSNIITHSPIDLSKNDTEKNKDFPELVVSVVTSKTVENNTMISPEAFIPINTSMGSSESQPVENSTDSWIVIASVQTSRSISGARYIPSSVVDQDERVQLLSEPGLATEPSVHEDSDATFEMETSPITPSSVLKMKTSTESLIDKLDRVQSDLSSGLLTGGFKNDNIAVIEENLSTKIETTTENLTSPPSTSDKITTNKDPYPQVNIRKFNAGNRPFRPKPKDIVARRKGAISTTTTKTSLEKGALNSILQKAKPVDDISALLPPGYKVPSSTDSSIDDTATILKNAKPVVDISALLPPGYKPPSSTEKTLNNILSKAKPVEDISALLPPGYKPPKSASTEKPTDSIFSKAKPVDDISALLPPGYKPPQAAPTEKSNSNIFSKAQPVEDISALLPPGYKHSELASTERAANKVFSKAKPVDDISALLPPGYKPPHSGSTEKSANNILAKAKPVDDISALLPPGYKKGFSKPKVTTASSVPLETVSQSIPANLLPPGFKLNDPINENNETTTPSSIPSISSTSTSGTGFKVVFPSRPGGGARKAARLTTPKAQNDDTNKPTIPTIQKGWPVRASTEFTGWPTPSTTPISIEKLLEAARMASTSTSTVTPTESSSTTTTSTTTTTTSRPTTPGICIDGCDLAGTIKLIGGAKWVPELLDPNTKEYQILANSVQSELESIYNSSPILKKWYRKIRIDGFSEGSILVDYLVEFNEVGKKLDTQEIKRLFHESLTDITMSNREPKSLNDSKAEKFSLGQFEVDPKYTDFVVIPKHSVPTVGYAEDVLLPQWAIAVIVIGLASLLFVIIFGVTVLFNRHKNSKKTPAPLTEDMLNELNKNHMGGIDNYGVDDFYNMEDVWSDKHYEQKPHKKRINGSSLYDNSTSNLYDSWRSQWNGQWNAYNNHYGSQYSGHSGFRRPDHDTNF